MPVPRERTSASPCRPVTATRYPRIAAFKTADSLPAARSGSSRLICRSTPRSVPAPRRRLAQPLELDGFRVGNRFCILPMEGWDGTRRRAPERADAAPLARFGQSGAKVIWGGEAVAVRHDGRANPNQLVIEPSDARRPSPRCASTLVAAHRERVRRRRRAISSSGCSSPTPADTPGRTAAAAASRASPIAHPMLDRRSSPATCGMLTDDELDRLVDDFVARGAAAPSGAASRSSTSSTVTAIWVTSCSARRSARAGTAAAREPHALPALDRRRHPRRRRPACASACACRRSTWCRSARSASERRRARSRRRAAYRSRVRLLDGAPEHSTLRSTTRARCSRCSRAWACAGSASRAGSPYYNPHIQRPALFPPSDGYLPPEDPLRRRRAADRRRRRELKARLPDAGDRRLGLQLPAGVAAATSAQPSSAPAWPTSSASGGWCCQLSGDAGRRARGASAQAQAALPHVQRLHDRAAKRSRVGLLPARQVLRGAARSECSRRSRRG